jgi:tetratricopeptide (TPR) repeat protein/O-antigen ligase
VAEGALVAALLFAPGALGGVAPWALAVLLGLATLALLGTVVEALALGRGLVSPLALVPLGVLVAAVALQCLPLPPAVLLRLSPAADDLFRFVLGPRGLYPAWRPLSLDPPATAMELCKALTYLALFVTACQRARDADARTRLTFAVAGLGALLAGLAFLHQLFGMQSLLGFEQLPRQGLVSPFVNRNHLASVLALAALTQLGLAVRTRDRRVTFGAGLCFLLTGSEVLLSGSRAGAVSFLAAALCFSALVWIRGRDGEQSALRHRLALGLCFAAGVVAVAYFLNADRLGDMIDSLHDVRETHALPRIWPQVVPMVREHWLTGIGRGAFKVAFRRYQQSDFTATFTHPENVVMQLTSELGLLLGLGILVVLAGAWVEVARRSDLSAGEAGLLAGLFAVGLHEFADFGLEISGVAVPALLALALVTVRPHTRRRLPALAGVAALLAVPALGVWGLSREPLLVEHDRAALEAMLAAGAPADAVAERTWKALAHHPADAVLPLDAAIAAARGHPPEAQRALFWANRAMVLSPQAGWPHRLAAEALFLLHKPDQAMLEERLALPWFGRDPSYAADLRRVLRTPEQYVALAEPTPEGLALLLSLTEPEPKLSLAVGELALSQLTLEVPDLLGELADRATRVGAPDKALTFAERAFRAQPQSARACGRLARAQLAQGLTAEAEVTFREGLLRSPGELGLSAGLAQLLASQKKFDEAHRLLKLVATPVPRDRVAALEQEAAIWHTQGLDTHAIVALRDAAALAPDDPQRHYALANLYLQLGRPREALAAIDRGLSIDGGGERAQRTTWRAEVQKQVDAQKRSSFLQGLQLEDDPRFKTPH